MCNILLIPVWKGNKMKGCHLSPSMHILVIAVASGTVARLFHHGVGPRSSNSPCCVAKETTAIALSHMPSMSASIAAIFLHKLSHLIDTIFH